MFLVMLACALPGFRPALAQGFYLSSSPLAGYGWLAVAAADFNGDGKIDLAGFDNNYVLTILTNNGNGGFSVGFTNFFFFRTQSVTTADVNHDGKVDIIAVNTVEYYGYDITILTNDGSGAFTASQTIYNSHHAYDVAVADIAGDTNVDLVVANSDATLNIYTNNGSGIFQLSATYSAGSVGGFQLAAADLNADGMTDLVIPNYQRNSITILTNSGGMLLSGATYDIGRDASFVAVADLNGDGRPDVAVASYYDSSVTILTNSPGGILYSNASYSGFSGAIALAIADVNGDGNPDIIVCDFGGQSMSILTNDGSGGFALAATLATGQGPTSVIAADLNGDGRIDLISYEYTLSVYLNQAPLDILSSGPNVLVTWPANATNWTLLQNTNLATTNWTAFDVGSIAINGSLKIATNKPASGNKFFRLVHP